MDLESKVVLSIWKIIIEKVGMDFFFIFLDNIVTV